MLILMYEYVGREGKTGRQTPEMPNAATTQQFSSLAPFEPQPLQGPLSDFAAAAAAARHGEL